jgi:hypothetical protein
MQLFDTVWYTHTSHHVALLGTALPSALENWYTHMWMLFHFTAYCFQEGSSKVKQCLHMPQSDGNIYHFLSCASKYIYSINTVVRFLAKKKSVTMGGLSVPQPLYGGRLDRQSLNLSLSHHAVMSNAKTRDFSWDTCSSEEQAPWLMECSICTHNLWHFN